MMAPAPALSLDDTKKWAEIIQSVATVLALLLGGIWTYLLFLRHRQKYPRAVASHEVTTFPVGEEGVVVHAALRVKNCGEVLIEVRGGSIRFYALDQHNAGWPLLPHESKIPDEGRDEFRWRKLGRHALPRDCEIEPGEIDYYHYEIYVPLSVKKLKIYSHFSNASKGRKKIGWNRTTIHDMSALISASATVNVPAPE
jgi:hypothetical protein